MSGDSTSINSGDIAGVTLAGVQALDGRTQVSAELIAALQGRLASLESEVAELRAQASIQRPPNRPRQPQVVSRAHAVPCAGEHGSRLRASIR